MTRPQNETADQELISGIMDGDDQAFRKIVRRYQSYVYALAYRYLNNCSDAEDILQESFIRVWNNKHKFKREIKFTTWLYRIVINLCYDKLKYRKRKANLIIDEYEVDDLSGEISNPANELQQKEINSIISRYTEQLSYKQKMVFTLRDLQNLSVSEVAEIMNISEQSVKTNLVYARRTLKEKISKYLKQDLI